MTNPHATGGPATAGPGIPRLYRGTRGRVLGGVAGSLADYLGLPRSAVRAAFVVLVFAGGMGVVLYGAFWIVLPLPPDEREGSRRTALQYVVALVAGAIALVFNTRTQPLGWWFLPSVLALFGGLLLWRQATETDRERWRRLSRASLTSGTFDKAGAARLVVGVVLVLTGGVFILARAGLQTVAYGLAAMLVTLTGIALITGPWWARLAGELSRERRERIRSEERADIAAHLHDSVLQTLALIQRNAQSPREVIRLARSQERELRTKLYGSGAPAGQFGAALQNVAAEVEDVYAVAVDVVIVGDRPLDLRTDALVAAAREAMVNAAKHAQVDQVSVYTEVTDRAVEIFIRDRGVGFDPAAISEDRQGVRGSILGRVVRHGGTATVRSQPGEGTEVAIRMEL